MEVEPLTQQLPRTMEGFEESKVQARLAGREWFRVVVDDPVDVAVDVDVDVDVAVDVDELFLEKIGMWFNKFVSLFFEDMAIAAGFSFSKPT